MSGCKTTHIWNLPGIRSDVPRCRFSQTKVF
ncbi:DNA invertase, partial [Cronobacter sakazakii]